MQKSRNNYVTRLENFECAGMQRNNAESVLATIAKVGVVSSNLIARSRFKRTKSAYYGSCRLDRAPGFSRGVPSGVVVRSFACRLTSVSKPQSIGHGRAEQGLSGLPLVSGVLEIACSAKLQPQPRFAKRRELCLVGR